MTNGFWVRSRRGYLSVGVSVLAMVAAVPAMAQCEPDPTTMNGLTECSGIDADGLRVTTNGTRVQVDAGAIVARAGDAAITVDMSTSQGSYFFYARSAAIDVAGTVAGISVLSGSSAGNYDSFGSRATITVAAGGTVGGASGILAGSSPDNPYGTAIARIDNSGTILGADGMALRSTSPSLAGFDIVTNRDDASMGAIAAPIGSLVNQGTIDGGAVSAIAQPTSYNSGVRQDPWVNGGTIRSNSADATILNFSTTQALTNSGTIVNTGSGEALKSGAIVLTNSGTGLVRSTGPVAIAAASYVYLENTGRIEGSVISGGIQQPFGGGSVVDSSAGVITGNLTLGGSNDTVVARYVGGGSLDTGVQGVVDAGDGIDTLQLRATTDTTISNSIALLPSFERFGIDVAAGTTTTLGAAFVSPGTVTVGGNGTLVNQGTIEAADQALLTADTSSYSKIINQGVIRTTSGSVDQYGVVLGSSTFSNEGEVRTAGAGINGSSSFANSGTISSVGTAVSLFGASFSNTGEIRSTQGTAVSLSGTGYGFAVTQNSGLIDGAVTGVSLSGTLVNTGTISSAQTAVVLGWGGTIDNRATGVISGGTQAIGAGQFGGNGSVVLNAGTIRGNVDFTGLYGSSYPSNNRFFALAGGVLEGDLKLGYGDILITQAVNTGSGQFAGINGNVTANNSDLRYQVRSDVTLTHAPVAGFATMGYELFDNAALTLTSAGGASQPVVLAGTGSVDMTLDIASTSQPAIQRTSLLVGAGYGSDVGVESIISRGTLSLTRSDPYGFYTVVNLISGDTFENAGTIEVRDATSAPYTPAAGISGGTVINSGTINLSNAVGVRSATSFTNTGSILQIAGGGAATGVIDTTTIVNSGRISVDGVAIGRSQFFYYPPTTVTNAAGGVLSSSSGTAVAISGGTFTNAGSVTGTVDLGFEYSASTPVRTSSSGAYVAAGGTVTGDILFGRGYDTFITKTGETGVSGIIDGGEGSDVFGYDLSSSRTITFSDNAQVRNFESLMLYARGGDTVLTLSGTNPVVGGLNVGGAGTVINQASIAERVTTQIPYSLTPSDYPIGLARFENQGTLQSGISAQVANFKNTGTIGKPQAYVYGIDIYNDGKVDFVNEGKIGTAVALTGNNEVSVSNSGTIVIGDAYRNVFLPTALDIAVYGEGASKVSISNSGTISADLSAVRPYSTGIYVASPQQGTIVLTNAASGTISASGRLAYGVLAFGGSLVLDNAGTIRGGQIDANSNSGAAVVAIDGSALIRNSGTIDGAVVLGGSADRVENSGTITGLVALGGGDDTFVQRRGSKLGATVNGGEGLDSFIVDSTGGTSLLASQIAGFERLQQIGSGTANYAGSFDLGTIDLQSGTMAVAAGQSLATTGAATVTGGNAGVTVQNAGTIAGDVLLGDGQDSVVNAGVISGAVRLGQGNDTYVEYAGSNAASIDGGAGSDLYRLVLSGNRSGITDVTNFERLAVEGSGTLDLTLRQRYDSVSLTGANLTVKLAGVASMGSLSLTGGRLIGLAGSTLTAPTITVGTGATFGSAGIVNGNVAVAGTLSPGASPGTMTVNGNVALAGTSTSVFEITPTVSDKLVVNGQLSIAQGATLQIVAADAFRPGQSLDLIVASGGITGSYTNIIKPSSLFGFLVQQDGRLTLRGEFANSTAFAPGVQSSIAYVNDLLRSGQASSAFLAAVPSLLTQGGATNAGAFARLTPEPYATATQIAVEHGLELAGTARGDAFAAPAQATGGFAFASALGSERTLQTGDGAADARTRSYGVAGGLGIAGENGSIGAFIGYLDSKQRLKDLAARTQADGVVAGIHGRWNRDQVGIKATIAYDGGKARTTRTIPGGQVQGRYDLRGWMADLAVDYKVPLSGNWTVQPSLGATAIRVTREGTVETGTSAFVLNVARNRDWAAFVDGALTFAGGQVEGSAVRPYLTLGVRYQFEGRTPFAVAALDRGAFALGARGVSRAPVVASATLGWDIALSSRASVFAAATGESGDADHRFSSRAGVKIAF